jgi:lysophospholipase L1-like esterase
MKCPSFVALAALLAFPFERVAMPAEPAHDFAKWEKEIAAYEQMDRTNPPPKDALLFIGSSTIRRWTSLAQDFPAHKVINRGFGGSEIADATHFADRLIFPHHPRMVLLRAGGNDINAGKSPTQVFADFKEFVVTTQARLPETDIVFISLCPSVARWKQADKEKSLNGMVQQYAAQTPRVRYIETYDLSLGPNGEPRPDLFVADKLHFNGEGYRLLAARVRSWLENR